MLRLTFIGALAVFGAVGCGGDDRGGGDSTTVDDFVPAFASASCDALDSCLGPIADVFLGDEDCATLLTEQITQSELDNLHSLIDSGRIVFRPGSTGDCLSAIRSGGCGGDGAASAACEDALEGTVPVGESCSIDVECVGDAWCDRTGLSCPGTCTARGAAGSPCSGDDQCEPALYCGGGGTCAAPAGAGEACEGATAPDCADGLLCLGGDDETMTPGTCRTPDEAFTEAEGAACDLDAGMLCQAGLSCVVEEIGAGGATFVCAGPSTAGAACTFGLPDPCPVGEYCNADIGMFVVMGSCTAKPRDGEPCIAGLSAVAAGGGCAAGHVCISGTCRTRADNGAACLEDAQCYSGNCNSGTCAMNPLCM